MLYVECNPDKIFLKALLESSEFLKPIRHEYGKGKICNRLKKEGNSIALIDEDPQSPQPKYLKNLEPLELDKLKELNIKCFYDKCLGNLIIMLSPRLEEWILKILKEININIRKYNLPNDANNLHKAINTNLNNFEKLIDDLKKTKKFKEIKNLIEKCIKIR